MFKPKGDVKVMGQIGLGGAATATAIITAKITQASTAIFMFFFGKVKVRLNLGSKCQNIGLAHF